MSVLDVLKKKKDGVKATVKPTAKVAKSDTGEVSATDARMHVIRSVIVRPHVSEKAYSLHAQNQYVFMVEPSANKILVKEEVQRRYNVHVTDVNISVHKGKPKNFRGRTSKRSVSKKAFVTLKEGDKIEIA